jgi:2-oxoglutarate ferredoxin oxidoreductase subunit beta
MDKSTFDLEGIDNAWCPGCGNFPILSTLKEALAELEIPPENLVMVSGIGQAAKLPHYLRTNVFNGLHGRGLPVATAIQATNPELTVVYDSGDGCTYGEGGNHFLHAIRRNPNVTCMVHNNMVYGLTKGQASPTSMCGFETPVQVEGVIVEPFNPLAVAVAQDASFVARAFAGDQDEMRKLMKKAISHKGFALLDIFQPCVSFNDWNTYRWFNENTYYVDEDNDYDPTDQMAALQKCLEEDPWPLGVIYTNPDKNLYTQNSPAYEDNEAPLYKRELDRALLGELIDVHRKWMHLWQGR